MTDEDFSSSAGDLLALHLDIYRLFSTANALRDIFIDFLPDPYGVAPRSERDSLMIKGRGLTGCDPRRADELVELIRNLNDLSATIRQRGSLFFWFTRAFLDVKNREVELMYGDPLASNDASYHERATSVACDYLNELPTVDQIQKLPDELASTALKYCPQPTDDQSSHSITLSMEAKCMHLALRQESAQSVPEVSRIIASVDPPQVTVDKIAYTISPDQAVCLYEVVEANGQWISSSKIREKTEVAKPDRVLRNLRQKLKNIDLIESEAGKGLRIKQKWLA